MWKRRVKKLAARGVRKLSALVGEQPAVVAGPSTRVRDEPETLLDRTYIANRGNRWERKAYHQLASRIKQGAIAERERLGAEYLKAHADDVEAATVTVDRATGLGAANLSTNPLVQAAVEEAQRITATRDPASCPSK